jgi:integrase
MDNTWSDDLDAWGTAMRAAGKSEQTISLRRYHIDRMARETASAPWGLTADEVIGWLGSKTWGWATRRSVRSSLRAWWRWGVATGRTQTDVGASIDPVPVAPPTPRMADPGGVVVAMRESDARVLLMLRLAHGLGLRRGEVARVHTDDLVRDLTGWSLRVHGKGSRDRVLPLPTDLHREISQRGPGFIFPGQDHGHLSARWVGKLVARALPGPDTMHGLRHLAATQLHDSTHDLRLVQHVLGHASLATTQVYVHIADDDVRAALTGQTRRLA